MRIIDKNKDFYDYAYPEFKDSTNTLDRRSSFVFSEEEFKKKLSIHRSILDTYALLQVCNDFWIFCINQIVIENTDDIKDYNCQVYHWKDYKAERKLISFEFIRFDRFMPCEYFKNIVHTVDVEIRNKYYWTTCDLCKGHIYVGNTRVEKNFPILKDLKIASLIDPKDIYNAFDEYLSLEKQDKERAESVNLTNNEKVVNHGFDTKSSFRGKNK